MPVFNGEAYVGAALDSILEQTFPDFALVVADNASTDGTQEIVLDHAGRDERVRYLRSPENRGASWNFNRVFDECTSPLFKWAAADDLLAPTFVERCLEGLEEAPPGTVVLATAETRWIGPQDELLPAIENRLDVVQSTPHDRLRHVIENVVWGNTAFGLIISDALRQTRLTGSFPSADLVLLAELALLGEFRVVREPLFFRRDHEDRSRQADLTELELAQWFDPKAEQPVNEFRNVFFEYLRGILHSPLPATEKWRCLTTAFSAWSRRYGGVGARMRRVVDSRSRGR